MTRVFRYVFLSFVWLFMTDRSFGQFDNVVCGTTPEYAQESYYGPGGGVMNGGREITNQGTLRVLVVYVRFQDDVRTSSDWPVYNTLPSYAQYFVEPTIPTTGIYTPRNMSDFINRASGGNGLGTLGSLRVVGEVYYVTTALSRSSYTSDAAVNFEVYAILDNPSGPFSVNFALYDNWTFMSGGYFVHSNVPDGIVDYMFINWRDCSISSNPDCELGGIKSAWTTLTTNDVNGNGQSVRILPTSGGTAYRMFEWGGPFDANNGLKNNAIFYPGEEFFHYMYGGSHIDQQGFNVGNVMGFALMTANAGGNICAYERYRAGWLTPTIVETPTEQVVNLQDTHVNNKAVMMPIRRDASNCIGPN